MTADQSASMLVGKWVEIRDALPSLGEIKDTFVRVTGVRLCVDGGEPKLIVTGGVLSGKRQH